MNKSAVIRQSMNLFCRKFYKKTSGLRKWKRVDFRRSELPEMFTDRFNDVYDLPGGLDNALLAYAGAEKDRILFNKILFDEVECENLILVGVYDHEDGEGNADIYVADAAYVEEMIDEDEGVTSESHQTEVVAIDLEWSGWSVVYSLKDRTKKKKTKKTTNRKTRTKTRKPKDHETNGFLTTHDFEKVKDRLKIPTTHLSSDNPGIRTLQRAAPKRKARDYSVLEMDLDTGELTLK